MCSRIRISRKLDKLKGNPNLLIMKIESGSLSNAMIPHQTLVYLNFSVSILRSIGRSKRRSKTFQCNFEQNKLLSKFHREET